MKQSRLSNIGEKIVFLSFFLPLRIFVRVEDIRHHKHRLKNYITTALKHVHFGEITIQILKHLGIESADAHQSYQSVFNLMIHH